MNDFVIKLAEKRIRIFPIHDYVREMCGDYIEDTDNAGSVDADYTVYVTEGDIDFEREKSAQEDELGGIPTRHFSDSYLETLAVYRKIAEKMPEDNTVLFHGSALCVKASAADGMPGDERAVIFTGPSGTGKSTHASLWRKHIEGVTMINDDKPLIKFRDGVAFVWGTPWDGKDRLNTNMGAPVRAICILKQADSNCISEISWSEAFTTVLQQTYRPEDLELMRKTLQLIGGLKDAGVRFYELHCNMEPEAAEMCHEAVFG